MAIEFDPQWIGDSEVRSLSLVSYSLIINLYNANFRSDWQLTFSGLEFFLVSSEASVIILDKIISYKSIEDSLLDREVAAILSNPLFLDDSLLSHWLKKDLRVYNLAALAGGDTVVIAAASSTKYPERRENRLLSKL